MLFLPSGEFHVEHVPGVLVVKNQLLVDLQVPVDVKAATRIRVLAST